MGTLNLDSKVILLPGKFAQMESIDISFASSEDPLANPESWVPESVLSFGAIITSVSVTV